MNSDYKLISNADDWALVSIAGWDCDGIVLPRKKIKDLQMQVEAIQGYVNPDGQHVAHVLWEQLEMLLSATEAKAPPIATG